MALPQLYASCLLYRLVSVWCSSGVSSVAFLLLGGASVAALASDWTERHTPGVKLERPDQTSPNYSHRPVCPICPIVIKIGMAAATHADAWKRPPEYK